MHVVSVASSFPRHAGDHAGAFLLDLAQGLAERGHRIHHVVPGDGKAPAVERLTEGVTVRRVPLVGAAARLAYGDGIGANLKRRPWLLRGVRPLMAALERGVLDELEDTAATVLMSHWALPAGLVAAAIRSRRSDLLHIGTVHGGSLQALAAWPWARRKLRGWAEGVDHAVFVSEDLRGKATRALGGELPMANSVRSMGVRCGDFNPSGRRAELRRDLAIGEDRFTILLVGRLIHLKGADLVIEACRDQQITVLVAGDGPERARLERRAAEEGVDARFLGHVSRERVAELLECADLFCQPSRLGPRRRSEGMPVAIVEAMASGTAVVASRTGGIGEVVRDGVNGCLFEAGNRKALGAIIAGLAADRDKLSRLAQSSMAAAAAHDYTQVAAHYGELFEFRGGSTK